MRRGFLVTGRGPALPPRVCCADCGFGVPGPRDDWRREDEAGATERWAFKRRRLDGSEEDERCGFRVEEVLMVAG